MKRRIWKNSFKRDTQAHAVNDVFKDFCTKSSIHGVQYFSERERHWSERFWWLVAFGLSVWLCGSSIQNIWIKWGDNPVTMSLNEREAPVSTIPFPTVTICPETKTYMNKLNTTFAFRTPIDNLTDIDSIRLKALSHVCKLGWIHFADPKDKYTNESIYDTIKDVALSLDDTIGFCMWQYKMGKCKEYFVPVLTEEGLCFAFNALNSREIFTDVMAPGMLSVTNNPNVSHWSLENGYDDGFNGSGYPLRIFNARRDAALAVMVRIYEHDLEYMCTGPIHGFKIILTTPDHVLKPSRHSFRVPLTEVVEIQIKAKLTITSDELRDYEPNQRKCYFSSERNLRFFKYYAQHNCETECLANFTNIFCGCVKFSMPRDRNTKICGVSSILCYQEAEKLLFGEDVIDGLKDKNAKSFREECNCLPACTSIVYDADIDRAKFDWKAAMSSYSKEQIFGVGIRPATITVSFRDHEVITLKRTEKYTPTDFLAVCGGLLGLFLGVSLLSIIEFIYYFTLRLYWTLNQRKSKSVPPLQGHTTNQIMAFDSSRGYYNNARKIQMHRRF